MPYLFFNIEFKITIAENIVFDVLETLWIENSIEKFSDAAKVTLPREFKNARKGNSGLSFYGKNLLESINVGDAIKIEVGYNGNLDTEFEGYITEIGAEIPLLIECEDEMYQLKKANKLSKTFSKISLKELLKFIAPAYDIEALDVNLGKFMINNATPYEVITALKEQYGIRCYFKGKVLHAGLLIDMKPASNHDFVFGRNIRESSDLKYLSKEKRQKKFIAVSLQKGTSKKLKSEYGENINGEVTVHAPVGLTQTELNDWVKKQHDSQVFEGYNGSVDGWLIPRVKAQDSIQLEDPNYTNKYRNGRYFVEAVTLTADATTGVKRKNKISFKL
ncbi:Phage protein D [Candidatus Ornithobacterium hominis]|uniref:hypothetical protein n=1 Tax=Candidatus Ornithobacterium hominis TaxID=2497989 RepID=UPI0024BC5486|nr:hypothetical protein [Candidatus Ornithobacterium hominis]CAI9429698.1 Phage protein D [Candidatus Ornithobacterium hominis]